MHFFYIVKGFFSPKTCFPNIQTKTPQIPRNLGQLLQFPLFFFAVFSRQLMSGDIKVNGSHTFGSLIKVSDAAVGHGEWGNDGAVTKKNLGCFFL